MILLVVDTQKGCFNEKLYAFETVKENIKKLITIARENGVEVAYVQHDDGPGTELDKGTDNYEIYEEFAPINNEKRFEKNVNSAFHPMTGLTKYLKSKGEKDIMTIGVSTDYCMDATIKSGFENGFNIIVPSYTNSTYDNPYFDKETAYKYFNEFMWGTRYAKVITVEQAIQLLQSEKSATEVKLDKQILFDNIDRIHTTDMGAERIKKNLSLDEVDVVEWCKSKIKSENAEIRKQGKNWYICVEGSIITVNAGSYTIITAHKEKR